MEPQRDRSAHDEGASSLNGRNCAGRIYAQRVDVNRGRFAELVNAESPAPDRLAEAALIIAAAVAPETDVGFELDRLGALAASCSGADAQGLSDELFGSGRFAGNQGDYYDPRNSVLPDVLDRGLGIPITLAVLFIDIARRCGVVVEGVGMPGHFLTRSGGVFFDPFHGGIALDEAGCERIYQRLAGRPVSLPKGSLQATPEPMILQRMLWNLRSIAEGRGDGELRFRVLGLLNGFDEMALQVRMAWASALAERGQFGEAALAATAAADKAPDPASARLRAMAERWSARLN